MRGRSNLYSIGEKDNLQIVASGTDIWDGPTTSITIPPSAGEVMQILSSNSNDTALGTGARTLKIHYLDSAGLEQTTTKQLNGLTAVDLDPTDIRYVQDIHTIDAGSGGVAAGNISIRSKTTPANVYNYIKAGGNMSLTINKMIPSNKTFRLRRWYGSAAGKQPVTLRLRSTDHLGTLYQDIFLFKDTVSLENSSFHREWSLAETYVIPSLSIVKISAWTSSAGAYVSAGFSGEMITNT